MATTKKFKISLATGGQLKNPVQMTAARPLQKKAGVDSSRQTTTTTATTRTREYMPADQVKTQRQPSFEEHTEVTITRTPVAPMRSNSLGHKAKHQPIQDYSRTQEAPARLVKTVAPHQVQTENKTVSHTSPIKSHSRENLTAAPHSETAHQNDANNNVRTVTMPPPQKSPMMQRKAMPPQTSPKPARKLAPSSIERLHDEDRDKRSQSGVRLSPAFGGRSSPAVDGRSSPAVANRLSPAVTDDTKRDRRLTPKDLESEIKRMYGSLENLVGPNMHVPNKHGHSEFCSCKSKGHHYHQDEYE